MLSTRMIIDHLMLSMNSKRDVLFAAVAAPVVSPIGTSVMLRHRGSPAVSLKSRQIGKCQLAAVDMDAAQFGAAMQRRKHFSGIEQALRIERAFQPLLLVQIDLGKHLAH